MTWDEFIEFVPRVRHNPPYDVIVPCFSFHPPMKKHHDTFQVVSTTFIKNNINFAKIATAGIDIKTG